jgi:hypothetical protein
MRNQPERTASQAQLSVKNGLKRKQAGQLDLFRRESAILGDPRSGSNHVV